MVFVRYEAPAIGKGGSEVTSWLRNVQLIEDNLRALLRLPHHRQELAHAHPSSQIKKHETTKDHLMLIERLIAPFDMIGFGRL